MTGGTPPATAPGHAANAAQAWQRRLLEQRYLADRGLATAVHLALELGRPLLVEGDPGVGKTELAKVLAQCLDVPLLRLQCYEGIDAAQALYEWDHPRQLLHLRAMEAAGASAVEAEESLYSERFLLERPLLSAVRRGRDALLLIDEIDRADDEFEAFLLELLADFQISIPEYGVVRGDSPPVIILTSNRTRELHDALRRRCLYHWIDHPPVDREAEIVRLRAPDVPAELARGAAQLVQRLRELDLFKSPGLAETIDWARGMAIMGADRVTRDAAAATLGAVVKDPDDLQRARAELAERLGT